MHPTPVLTNHPRWLPSTFAHSIEPVVRKSTPGHPSFRNEKHFPLGCRDPLPLPTKGTPERPQKPVAKKKGTNRELTATGSQNVASCSRLVQDVFCFRGVSFGTLPLLLLCSAGAVLAQQWSTEQTIRYLLATTLRTGFSILKKNVLVYRL